MEEKREWRCFHCDEVFTNEFCARKHFGAEEGDTPACLIKGAEGGLLAAIRGAQESERHAWNALHSETTDVHRALYAAQSRTYQAVRDAEELGFQRGIDCDVGIDMNAEAAAAFGNEVRDDPGVPELSAFDALRVQWHADMLAQMAAGMKAEAREARGTGRAALALLLIRVQLVVEECGEWAEAMARGSVVDAAKELTDLAYVVDGSYGTLGLADLKLPLYRAVHASNMSKLDPETGRPIISDAGRWVKGPAYAPAEPEVGRIVAERLARAGE